MKYSNRAVVKPSSYAFCASRHTSPQVVIFVQVCHELEEDSSDDSDCDSDSMNDHFL